MNNKFDELSKGLAQSVTRRQALRRFGVGLAGVALAILGLPNKAEAIHGENAKNCVGPCIKQCLSFGGSKTYCHDLCSSLCHSPGR